MGPALFSLGFDQITRSAVLELNIWYLDDATHKGESDTVVAVFPLLSTTICTIRSSSAADSAWTNQAHTRSSPFIAGIAIPRKVCLGTIREPGIDRGDSKRPTALQSSPFPEGKTLVGIASA